MTANPTTATAGQNVTLTATVATQSNATASSLQEPTGSVQFFVGGAQFGGPQPVTGGINSGTLFAQATAQLSTTTLASGQDKITAQYLGDNNYLGSTTASSVTVNVGGAGINVTPCTSSSITISSPGQTGTCHHRGRSERISEAVTLTCGISLAPPSANRFAELRLARQTRSSRPPAPSPWHPGLKPGRRLSQSTLPRPADCSSRSTDLAGLTGSSSPEIAAALACLLLLSVASPSAAAS